MKHIPEMKILHLNKFDPIIFLMSTTTFYCSKLLFFYNLSLKSLVRYYKPNYIMKGTLGFPLS